MTLPLIRLQPWYPGQLGVYGSDVPRGLRWEPTGIVMYVDNVSADANDAHDGTNPEAPMLTIQAAVTKLIAHQTAQGVSLSGSVIVVAGTGYTENVVIPNTAPKYCTLMGGGPTAFKPTWAATTATAPCLDIRAEGWVIEGFEFDCPASAAGVRVVDTLPVAADTAYKAVIRDCVFDGLWSGLYGIEFYGAPHRVHVLNNWFLELNAAGAAYGIIVTDSTHSNPYECAIVGNRFTENDNHVGSLGSIRAWNVSLFKGNIFEEGVINPTTLYLDLRGGTRGYNIVTGNWFGGAYTNAGGYYANAATPNSCWVGNFAEPTPATVGDNGLTVAVPA